MHISWKKIPPTLFILSGQDPISQKAKSFVKAMESAGLEMEVIEYENAVHSFIESNNPEGRVEGSIDMSDVIIMNMCNLHFMFPDISYEFNIGK